jgi:hypothetical protein
MKNREAFGLQAQKKFLEIMKGELSGLCSCYISSLWYILILEGGSLQVFMLKT